MKSPLAETLAIHDATSLAAAIRSRELSAVDVIAAHFERIDRLNGKYNALVTLDKQRAIQHARQADCDLARGILWGPLHGVPMTIKDCLNTAQLRTTVGYDKYRNFTPERDAWVVGKLKDAGAIVIGKTNCARLCCDIQTGNGIFGRTGNPWNTELTCGGSSGGEAVAVALGMSPLGIGSDTGGSIRIPSSYCGIFGLKTSIGKLSREGLLPLHDRSHAGPDSLTVVGPMARSIRDLMLCYRILSNETDEDEDTASASYPTTPQIHWTHEIDSLTIDDEVRRVMGDKFSALLEHGVAVTKVPSPMDFGKLLQMYLRLAMFEFTPKECSSMMYHFFWLFESVRSVFRGGPRGGYMRLKREQAELSTELESFLQGCDAWVIPATPSVAFAHQKTGFPITLTDNGRRRRCGYWAASMGLTSALSVLGKPSVVIPVGKSKHGLPVAIQVVGRLGEDRKLLKAAAYLAGKIGKVDFTPISQE